MELKLDDYSAENEKEPIKKLYEYSTEEFNKLTLQQAGRLIAIQIVENLKGVNPKDNIQSNENI